MGNILNNLNKEIDGYGEDMALTISEQQGIPMDDDIYYTEEFKFAIEADLEDKGFSTKEAQEVAIRDISKETAYKMLAYCYVLYNDYNTIDELKTIIQNDSESNLDDFTKDDLKKILKYREKIDF